MTSVPLVLLGIVAFLHLVGAKRFPLSKEIENVVADGVLVKSVTRDSSNFDMAAETAILVS